MINASQIPLTVYFDGACPVCRREIGLIAARTGSDVDYCDVSAEAILPENLNRQQALQRFHVRLPDGRLVSGAEAFVSLWSRVPGLRMFVAVLKPRPVLAVLDLLYSGFLRLRRLWR
jgi:predicted DCC family thiol-disulfide oxidoreductase YuxK